MIPRIDDWRPVWILVGGVVLIFILGRWLRRGPP
jgi:hypothetical protein